MRRSTTVVAALAAAGLLASCGGTAEPSVPEGWRVIEQGWLSVQVPEDWVEAPEQKGGSYDLVLEDDPADPGVLLIASTEYGDSPAWAVLSLVRDLQPFGPLDDPGTFSEVEREDDLYVERWDFTYGDGENRGAMWAAGDEDAQRTVTVGVAGTTLTEQTIQRIEDSIQVLSPEDAPDAEDA